MSYHSQYYADKVQLAHTNSHLIAFTSELLEALEHTLGAVESEYLSAKDYFEGLESRIGGEAYETEVYEEMERAKDVLNKVRAAISKAEGETS